MKCIVTGGIRITPSTTRKHRFYGLDFIKFWAFIAMVFWHYSSVLWADYNEFFFFKDQSPAWDFINYFCRTLANGGHVIVAVTAFLTGYHGTKVKAKWFLAFLILGIVVFPLIEKRDPNEPIFDWDIYGLILVGFLMVNPLGKVRREYLPHLTAVFFALSFVPFWRFGWLQNAPLFLRSVFVGDCVEAGGQWPILPWLFFMMTFMAAGRWLGTKPEKPAQLKFHWRWVGFWIAVLAISVPQMGIYFEMVVNNDTHCIMFTSDPFRFWAQLAPFVCLGHFSLMDRVNDFLRPYLTFLQKSEVVSSLWLPYFLQYFFANAFEDWFGSTLRSDPLHCMVGMLVIWPLCEILSRAIKALFRRINRRAL